MPGLFSQPGTDPEFWQYDPSKIILVWKGLHIGGFADGTMVEIERRKDNWEVHVSTTGAIARTRTRDDVAKATFTLLSQSTSADYLLGIAASDADNWDGVGPFILSDNNNGMRVFATEAWITKTPKITRSGKSDTITFEMTLADYGVIDNLPETTGATP